MAKDEHVKLLLRYADEFGSYSAAEVGRLVLAMMEYHASGVEPEFSGNERFVWPAFRRDIDREKAALSNARESGKKGGRPRKTETEETLSKGCERVEKGSKGCERQEKREGFPPCSPSPSLPDPLIPTPYNPPSSEKRENTPPQSPQGAAFDEFWAEYPKKVGKIAAKKAFERAIRAASLESLLSAVRRQKCGSQWTRDGGQYIPNPATWLNQGRWEDELPEEPGAAVPPRRRYETRVIDGREVDVEVADDD